MYKNQKIHLISFNSTNFNNRANVNLENINDILRILEEANNMKIFDKVKIFNEYDFDEKYLNKLQLLYNKGFHRGFVYYIWKPYLIYNYLNEINDNDFILYIDIGCALNNNGINRFYDYLDLCNNDYNGIVGFNLNSNSGFNCLEKIWTKEDVFNYIIKSYNIKDNILIDKLYNTDLICASSILCRKSEKSLKFFYEWMILCNSEEGFDALIDKEGNLKNDVNFIESRHDLSIFSLMCKIFNVSLISDEECYEWKCPENLKGKTPILHHIKYIK